MGGDQLQKKEDIDKILDEDKKIYDGEKDEIDMSPLDEYPTDEEEKLYTTKELMIPLKTIATREAFDFQASHQRMVQEYDKKRKDYYEFASENIETEKKIIEELNETLKRIYEYEEK